MSQAIALIEQLTLPTIGHAKGAARHPLKSARAILSNPDLMYGDDAPMTGWTEISTFAIVIFGWGGSSVPRGAWWKAFVMKSVISSLTLSGYAEMSTGLCIKPNCFVRHPMMRKAPEEGKRK